MSASVVVRLPSLPIFEEAESILEALPDGMLMTDARGRITYANVRMEHMSGYDRRELLDTSVDLLVPKGRACTVTNVDRFNCEPRTRPMGTKLDTRLLRSDGTELPVQVQLSPIEIGGRPWSWPRFERVMTQPSTSIRSAA